MKHIGSLLVAAILIASTVEIQAFHINETYDLTIRSDRGGRVIRYALHARKMTKQNRHVRFAGRCDSACTLYLSMPKQLTCISPGASFGFHLPYGVSERTNKAAARFMMRSYPKWVRNWIYANGGLRRTIKTMGYSYASKYIQPCKTTQRFTL